jgi:antitoxin component of MazEF toxin-antitoxin module
MNLIIKKWGNSLGVRIPKNIAERGKLALDQEVSIEVVKDQVVITPIPKKKEYSLQELLDRCSPEALTVDDEDRVWLNDEPVGKEML